MAVLNVIVVKNYFAGENVQMQKIWIAVSHTWKHDLETTIQLNGNILRLQKKPRLPSINNTVSCRLATILIRLFDT